MSVLKKYENSGTIFIVVTCLLFFSYTDSPVNAQQQAGYKTTVRLKIDASSRIKPGLEGYIKKELGSLDYVSMVTNDPDWQLSLIAETLASVKDDETVVISLLISKPFENEIFSFLVNDKYKDIFLSSSENLHELKSQILYTGNSQELHDISKRIVTDFNARFLEKERTEFNITNRNLEQLKR